MIWPTFEDFWDLYQKKVGRPKALLYWDKLTQKEKESAMEHIPMYIESQPDKKFRKDPERYLRYKCFEDEIIPQTNGTRQTTNDQRKEGVLHSIAKRYQNP
jgi:hypothetical protein